MTYGKKNIVCKTFWNHFIEFKATEIISAKAVEQGTVTKTIIKVFGIAYLVKLDSNAPVDVGVKPKITPKLLIVKPSNVPDAY